MHTDIEYTDIESTDTIINFNDVNLTLLLDKKTSSKNSIPKVDNDIKTSSNLERYIIKSAQRDRKIL